MSTAGPDSAPGVIRPARRPPGWIAPGPRPRTPDAPDLRPGHNEDLCFLAGDFRIFQRKDGHRWSADDLITAHFAITSVDHAPARIVDLGCGIGTVLLFLAWRFPDACVTGIEAQEISASLARRSIAWNGIESNCQVRTGDLRSATLREGLAPADLVTGTPPYLPVGTGPESRRVQCGPCRFEHRGGIEDYCLAAAAILAPGAPFVACAAGFQRDRVIAAGAAAGLSLTAWKDVYPKPGKPPLFSVFCLRSAPATLPATPPLALLDTPLATPPAVDLPPLYLRGKTGMFTVEHDLIRHSLGIPVQPVLPPD